LLPERAIQQVESLQRALIDSLGADASRAVPRELLHVTIAFLGNLPDEHPSAVVAAMCEHLAGAAAVEVALGEVELFGGGGVLAPTVVGPDIDEFVQLRDNLANGLIETGLLRDDRRLWRPHLTVVRSRGRRHLSVPRLPEPVRVDPFVINEIALFASMPVDGQHRYEIRDRVQLRRG
jgi:2'-5' RNA ligase